MDSGNWLISGLDALAEQFLAQATQPCFQPPSTRSTSAWPWACKRRGPCRQEPSSPSALSRSGTRTGLWAGEPYDLAIEVKYLRSHPSGSQPGTEGLEPLTDGLG